VSADLGLADVAGAALLFRAAEPADVHGMLRTGRGVRGGGSPNAKI